MIRCEGKEFDSISKFDCHVLSFEYKEGGGWATVLPISSAEYRKNKPTRAGVKVVVGQSSTKFNISDDWGNITTVDIDNIHSGEIERAILAANAVGLLST